MPVSPTYPGLYLEEIPSSAHSIVAAPTSVAVFVGYTHPFQDRSGGKPTRLHSFSDFERVFGGFFQSGVILTDLPHAVYQFFLNGGSDCYVVGIKPKYQLETPAGTTQDITPETLTINLTGGASLQFEAKVPTDLVDLSVLATNISSSRDSADFILTYGRQVETFRAARLADGFDAVVNASSLIRSVARPGFAPGSTFPDQTEVKVTTTPQVPQLTTDGTFSAGDYTPIFQANGDLDKVEIFNLLVLPGVTDPGILSAALAFAERKQAFMIIDPPANTGIDEIRAQYDLVPKSQNGAFYYPYLEARSPLDGSRIELAPSGFVAGIFARTDTQRGVWKAPAGLQALVKNTTGVIEPGRMTNQKQGEFNDYGINCIRDFSGIGTVVFGARTLVSHNTSFQDYWYVPVRRMALFIEQTLLQNLKWVIFEPNDEPLWHAIRVSIGDFMLSLFNQQALQGSKPSDAFLVKCDETTTTPSDQANGIVNIVVAFAPLKPAEFVVIKIAQIAGQTQSS